MQTAGHIDTLTAQFQARRSVVDSKRQIERQMQSAQLSEDRVEISMFAEMTVDIANSIVRDSVTVQINKALQEAGIDLKVVESGGQDLSPEGTARRIVDFAAGFLDAFKQTHVGEPGQIRGFMSLTRTAIVDGFQGARSVLEGITELSDSIEEGIDRTFALTNQYLDDFYQAQVTQPETVVEV